MLMVIPGSNIKVYIISIISPFGIYCCAIVNSLLYSKHMIKSFKHKELKKFFTTGSTARINSKHESKLEVRLQALHTATCIDDMDIPGWRLHKLTGKMETKLAINVSGNWRIVFEFINGHAYIVDYLDSH